MPATPPEHQPLWQPLTPREIAAHFAGAPFPWWIAGGLAIDHFVGRRLRPHEDIDVLVLRCDQGLVQEALSGWDCMAADPPGTLRPWRQEEFLPPSVSCVWCRPDRSGPWRMELLLDEGDRVQWRSRRCPSAVKPAAELGLPDASGIRFLAPEVQLFYKAKAPRPKDEIDFAAALPLLSPAQTAWLRDAILAAYSAGNAWLDAIHR
jgi:hypothetical protein